MQSLWRSGALHMRAGSHRNTLLVPLRSPPGARRISRDLRKALDPSGVGLQAPRWATLSGANGFHDVLSSPNGVVIEART